MVVQRCVPCILSAFMLVAHARVSHGPRPNQLTDATNAGNVSTCDDIKLSPLHVASPRRALNIKYLQRYDTLLSAKFYSDQYCIPGMHYQSCAPALQNADCAHTMPGLLTVVQINVTA